MPKPSFRNAANTSLATLARGLVWNGQSGAVTR